MSSTKRGYDRHKFDYYITPVEEIEKFIKAVQMTVPLIFDNDIILDPCSGGDANSNMSYPVAINKLIHNYKGLITVDIRQDSKAAYKMDYFNFKPFNNPDIIITNPPFNIALEVVKKGLEDVKENGFVIMLLRLNFFGSDKRNKWLRANMPKYCFVHAKRMSFTKNGKTDSIEYAHFVWQKGYQTTHTNTYLLEY